ncbi:MAG: HAMP domain-containing histidine kinase [Spirochaetales bacterium]|nr:HAMP domain-containing histidine kinase [Spirochaetales bacterium]
MRIPVPASLHIPTLMIAIAVVYAASLLFGVLLYATHRTFSGAKLWIAGQFLLAVGAVGLILQAQGLPYSILAVSNVAMLASVMLIAHALWFFRFTSAFPSYIYILLPLSLAAWFVIGESALALRIVVFSGLLFVLSAGLVVLLFVRIPGDPYQKIYRLPAVFYILLAIVSLARVIMTVAGSPPITIAEYGAMGGVEYVLALFAAFLNLFGYYVLASAKSEHDLVTREEEIRHRNNELMETIATKDALIAVIGHDLRAPVWSATRYVRSHLVEYQGDLNSKRESIETLAEGLERISGLLDSLLEWALCASGRIKLEMKSISVDDVVSEAIADNAATAREKLISFDVAKSGLAIIADHRALATVIRNLVSNAVKYSREGATIAVRTESGSDELAPHQRIIVADSGVGMKPEQVATLFVPGRTILTLGTAGEQGKGFGLAVSKLFVEAMNGTMTVESTFGTGTSFILDFPMPQHS